LGTGLVGVSIHEREIPSADSDEIKTISNYPCGRLEGLGELEGLAGSWGLWSEQPDKAKMPGMKSTVIAKRLTMVFFIRFLGA
jgi:hypothetical protein